MDLIIVESPTKARTLNKFLSKTYQVEATVGHVRDLPKSKLGVNVDKDFKPDWEIVKGKDKVIKKISETGKSAKNILLATDPDREGEAIAWHVYQILKENKKISLSKKQVKRITFHEITKDAIEHAIKAGGKLNENLFDAQQARRVVDRLVGYKLSPVLWRKIRRGLSAGRVQSVAVRLIVEKEREREAFKPEEYWEIVTELNLKSEIRNSKQISASAKRNNKITTIRQFDNSFFSWLTKINNKPAEVKNETTAMQVMADLDIADYSVKSIIKKEARFRPSPPFTTSTLQQTAGNKFNWSAKNTMRVAQSLYEKGLITYHRTDSLNISEKAIVPARAFIKKEYGDKYLSESIRRYKTKAKVAQEAHEAIRPTNVTRMPGSNGLALAEKRLYQLIWQRFVATQMADAVYDRTKILIEANVLIVKTKKISGVDDSIYELITEGKVRKFDGWLKVFGKAAHDDELPSLEENQLLQLIEVTGGQRFTEPPVRYSEATLIKKLEELGIGRPSTYAPTIATIQDRGYVEKVENRLLPTSVGFTTNDFLVKYFSTELDYQFTAKMEGDLDCIARGECEWVPIVKDFYQSFGENVNKALEVDRVKVPTEKTGEKCPECSVKQESGELEISDVGEVVIRMGRFGKFLSCSRFPDCRYTARYLETIGIKCPECGEKDGGAVIVKKSIKRKRIFYGCSRWPGCKWVSWNDPRREKSSS
jgi:DNA topoisomerase-1